MPSGSLVTLLVNVTLPRTRLRSEPIQHVCWSATVRLPPITLSSASVYWGLPVLGLDSAASLDHGAGMGYLGLKHPPELAPPAAPPPPPSIVTLPPMVADWITTAWASSAMMFPPTRSKVMPGGFEQAPFGEQLSARTPFFPTKTFPPIRTVAETTGCACGSPGV